MYIKSNFIEISKFENKFKKFENIPFSFFFDYIPTLQELSLNPINIFAHDEPNEYFGHHDWLLQNKDYFSLILTWNQNILDTCENSRFLPYGESWVDHLGDKILYENHPKDFEISFIRGNKLLSDGHVLRHQIFDNKSKITIPNRFYPYTSINNAEEVINSKIMLHKNSMFSLIIENTSHDNYFTEKISDAMALKTIPLYWGCKNIDQFYNIQGIILIDDLEDAIKKINSLTPEYYYDRVEVINENWEKSFSYQNYTNRIFLMLEETFKLNNML
jgi:hypothetical protein